MVREIILVEVVNKGDMSTDKSKAFTNTDKAKNYFADLIREMFSEMFHTIEQDDIDNALDDGFYDYKLSYPDGTTDERSVITKCICFDDDLINFE